MTWAPTPDEWRIARVAGGILFLIFALMPWPWLLGL